MTTMKFTYDKPLIKGLIKARPNRFIMDVEINGTMYKCHCPVTGKIGDIVFNNIPCLLLKSDDLNRKTQYTVESISIDNGASWIGINQTRMNKIVEFCLKTNQLSDLFGEIQTIKREAKFHDSKLDFFINSKHYLEVKTLLRDLDTGVAKKQNKSPKGIFYERLVKHLGDLSKNISDDTRAVILLCFTYNATPFSPPNNGDYSNKIFAASEEAKQKGVETWQANLKFDQFGVELVKYFPLSL